MTGRNVPLSESVDGHLHAAGHRADKVGELSDTKGGHLSSLCGESEPRYLGLDRDAGIINAGPH